MKKITIYISIVIYGFGLKIQAQNWTPLGGGVNSYVRALCVFNQKLFVGGDFIAANGTPNNRVAIWDSSNTWIKADSAINWVSTRCFTTYNNELYAGRDFGISKWDGYKWVAISGISSQVYEMAVYKNELYAVGQGNMQKWNGTNWSSIGTPNSDVYSVCVYNGELIVAGAFTSINGIPYNHIAKWNGSSWSSLGIGILGGLVSKIKRYKGELYVTGGFSASQGNSSDYLTKWNGSSWAVAIPNITNQIGTMDSISGKLCWAEYSQISTWDGITLNGFGTGMNANVYTIVEYGGSFYIGGDFTMVGGNLNLYISKWELQTNITNFQFEENNFNISPNPFSNETILESDEFLNDVSLIIYDCFGNEIKFIKNINNKKITLQRDNLTNGIYYIRMMKNNNLIISRKLIIVD